MRKTYILFMVLFLATYAVFFPKIQGNKVPQEAFAQSTDVCPNGNGWTKIEGLSGLSYTFIVPTGYEVTENCMKVGSQTPVYGTGETVVNTTLFNSPGGVICTAPRIPHNGCALQSISHASFKLQAVTTPTPTNGTVTPSPTVTATPTPTTFECPNGYLNNGNNFCTEEECEVDCEESNPSPTLTITITVTPTVTDSPKENSGSGTNNNPASGSVGGSSASRGEVLGTTTFAPTGVFTENVSNGMLAIGSLLTVAASALYAKKE